MGTHATDQRRPPQLDYQKPSELSDKCCCCCSTQRELAPDPQARDTRATIAMDGGVADTTAVLTRTSFATCVLPRWQINVNVNVNVFRVVVAGRYLVCRFN
jgi:hypothetical protein